MRLFTRAFLSGFFVLALAASGQALSLLDDGDFSDDPGTLPSGSWYFGGDYNVSNSAHSHDRLPDDPNAHVAGGSSLRSLTTHLISASESYTISYLAAWLSGDASASVEVAPMYLYHSDYGDMPMPISGWSQSLSLTDHVWGSHQFVFTPTAGEDYIGKRLGISLGCSNSSSNVFVGFDTVSIEVSDIPEPSVLVLLATGALSLLACALCRRRD
jgi:hypothetical protein